MEPASTHVGEIFASNIYEITLNTKLKSLVYLLFWGELGSNRGLQLYRGGRYVFVRSTKLHCDFCRFICAVFIT